MWSNPSRSSMFAGRVVERQKFQFQSTSSSTLAHPRLKLSCLKHCARSSSFYQVSSSAFLATCSRGCPSLGSGHADTYIHGFGCEHVGQSLSFFLALTLDVYIESIHAHIQIGVYEDMFTYFVHTRSTSPGGTWHAPLSLMTCICSAVYLYVYIYIYQ
jgi:hypothetical protein